MAACRFYRDPLRRVDFMSSKTAMRLIFWGIKISENEELSTKTYVEKRMLQQFRVIRDYLTQNA